jgi:predicted DCC family thiol-disulfide oxidoreductase YuxK
MTLNTLHDRAGDGPVLLYDGVCALCNAAVRFVLKFDATQQIRFAPLDGAFAAAVFERHPDARGSDSVVLWMRTPDGREIVRTRSAAVLELGRHMKYLGQFARVVSLLPPRVLDGVYDAIAARRYRLFGRYESCPVPDAGVRHRFIP